MDVDVARTKRDRIVDELHQLILSGQLPRGSRLRQDELAERFETSITPVREALRLLESEGLVIGQAHRGVRIASIADEDLKATYVMRRLVEPYAVRRATIRVSRRDLQRAEALNEQMGIAGDDGDHWGVREANRAFHFMFYDRCGIAALPERIKTLWLVFPWDIALVQVGERARGAVAEHEAMLVAVRDGDGDAAAEATATHLLNSYRVVTATLTGLPAQDPFPVDAD
jgi:DNA-binding GntR family transcriptional regulator